MSHARPPFGEDNTPDYLWDRSGPVDDDIAALERALSPLRWQASARRAAAASSSTPLSTRVIAPVIAPRARLRRRRIGAALAAIAASLLLTFGLGAGLHHRLQWPASQGWRISEHAGQASIDGIALGADATLAPGQWLETGEGRARLRAARIGDIVIGEHSRFRIVRTQSGRHRTQLQQGVLWARVWAPPGQFGVDAPMGEVIDLGCEFLLRAEADGSGSLSVRSGWVQLDNGWREVLVPQGTRVDVAVDGRFGTPYDLRSSAAFRTALKRIDEQRGRMAPDDSDVRALLAQAGPHDAITLLQLLQQHPALVDGPVFDHLAAMMPADAALTREQVRREGRRAYSVWWKQLPYPRTKQWWLHWPDAFGARAPAQELLREGEPR